MLRRPRRFSETLAGVFTGLGLGWYPQVQHPRVPAGAGASPARGGSKFNKPPRQVDELQHMLLPARRYTCS